MADSRFITLRNNGKSITGRRFGRLLVLGPVGRKESGEIEWLCECECGAETVALGVNIRHGRTTSCGCRRDEVTGARSTKHGMTKSSEYLSWSGISQRCLNKRCKEYRYYGGRGIVMADRWRGKDGFETFMSDMGTKPTSNHTIERKDVNGNYEPANCIWATKADQQANKRNTVRVTYKGETAPLAVFCRRFGLAYATVSRRLECEGWTVEEALDEPTIPHGDRVSRKRGRTGRWGVRKDSVLIEFRSEAKPLGEWMSILGLGADRYRTYWHRIKVLMWSPERAFSTPVRKTHLV